MSHPKLPSHAELLRHVGPARGHWSSVPLARPDPVRPGQESVWEYPRPPEVRPAGARVRVVWAGQTIADTARALKVCETAGAPVYYLPPDDVAMDRLRPVDGLSVCEWKGASVYYDLIGPNGEISRKGAFSYPDPLDDLDQDYARIAGWIAFYAGRVDGAYLGDMRAQPQAGGLYAGWVTPNIAGPIKGAPGTEGW